jgi:hypothetical protein
MSERRAGVPHRVGFGRPAPMAERAVVIAASMPARRELPPGHRNRQTHRRLQMRAFDFLC